MPRRPSARAAISWPLAIVLLLGLGGCLRSPIGSSRAEAGLIARGDLLIVPSVVVPPARGPAGCGAQALAAVLAHGDPAGPSDPVPIGDALPWHETGATPVDLLLAARARGWTATVRPGDRAVLAAEIAAGHLPLVMFDAGLEVRTLLSTIDLPRVMHWAVVTGVSASGDTVLLGAPRGRHHVVDADWFETRWDRADRCTLLLRPPDDQSAGP